MKKFKMRYITPYTPKRNFSRDFIVFDSETYTTDKEKNIVDITRQKLKYGFAKYVKEKSEIFEFTHKRDFTSWLINRFKYDKQTIYVWAHNTQFDIRVCLDFNYLIRNSWKFLPISVSPFIFKLWRNEDVLVFLDTMSFFKTSLEKLGEKLGIEKIKIEDFATVDFETLKKRCQIDVEITEKVVKYLYSMMIGRVSYSLPQLAFKIMRSKINYPLECLNSLSQESYFGGRTEIYQRGKIDNVSMFDVNSMYPYAMLSDLPVKQIEERKNTSVNFLIKMLESDYGITAKVKVKIPYQYIPPIPFRRDDKKLIFPIGDFITTLNSPELKLIQDYIIEVKEIEVYQMDNFLKSYVDEFYSKRKNADNEIDKEFYKLLLNSLYGKFGQKMKKTTEIKDKRILLPYDFYTGQLDVIDECRNKIEYKCFNGIIYKTDILDRVFSTAVSSFICSYARSNLFEKIQKVNENIIYVDTDSLIITKEAENDFLNDIGSDLGKLKKEKEGSFIGYRCKLYYFNEDLKCKGVPKKSILDWKEQQNILFAEYNHIGGLNESIRRFNTTDIIEFKIKKELNLIDDKRNWEGNFSEPIALPSSV